MKTELTAAMKDAMRAKDKLALTTIRSIIAAIQYEEMQTGKDELDSVSLIAILKNEEKKRLESMEFSEKAGRTEEIATLEEELVTVRRFLPSQLSEQQLTEKLSQFKATNADANMGSAMKYLKDAFPGEYDGKMASAVAKNIFG
jgi:uncharacterized protein